MELKGQDILVLLKRAAHPSQTLTYAALGEAVLLSVSQVHRSVRRCLAAGLAISMGRGEWRIVRGALIEFAVHGVRYAFPASLGPTRRGIATSFGAPPLSARISAATGEAPVWAHPKGDVRGPSVSPICKTAPDAALIDSKLYELLALIDALRMGRARERELARKLLTDALEKSDAQ